MKFLNVHSIYIVFMYIYTKSGKIKKNKKICSVILLQYTEIDSTIFNL